ncbi:MAG: thiamine phosphate synthase [Chloroflexota bacterium]|nr:thiamine phosphate synthase [Chloroflexota bacterium]
MSHQALRIVDANLNRASEGLRFLEDIARFLLSDAALSRELKTARHSLAREARLLDMVLLSHRDSERDVGTASELSSPSLQGNLEGAQQGLPGLIAANAKRVEESLRVIAELAKLPELSPLLDSSHFEQLRFKLYILERKLTSRVLRRDKIEQLTGLYVILDRQALAGRDMLETAEQVIKGGARVLQLRDKLSSRGELLPLAQELKVLCIKAGILFIVNDYLDVALAVNADGLHIGQKDLPLTTVRKILPIDKIVGLSVTTREQALKAEREGVDYIAVGSMFPTTGKEGAVLVGVETLRQVRKAVSVPLVAIGGINEDNVGQVMAGGASAVAVIGAVLSKEDVKEATRRMAAEIDRSKEDVY